MNRKWWHTNFIETSTTTEQSRISSDRTTGVDQQYAGELRILANSVILNIIFYNTTTRLFILGIFQVERLNIIVRRDLFISLLDKNSSNCSRENQMHQLCKFQDHIS